MGLRAGIRRDDGTGAFSKLLDLFQTARFLQGFPRNCVNLVVDADQLCRFGLLARHLRSAMLEAIRSSAVLPGLRASPSMPSPLACVAANLAKFESLRDLP